MEGEFKRGQFERDEPVIVEWDLQTDLGPQKVNGPVKVDGPRVGRLLFYSNRMVLDPT